MAAGPQACNGFVKAMNGVIDTALVLNDMAWKEDSEGRLDKTKLDAMRAQMAHLADLFKLYRTMYDRMDCEIYHGEGFPGHFPDFQWPDPK